MRRILLAALAGLAGLQPALAAETSPAAAEPATAASSPSQRSKATPSGQTAPTAPPAAAPAATPTAQQASATPKPRPKPLPPSLVARVDLTRQSMTVSVNGKALHRWSVSSGVKGYETPVGSFKPSWKAEMWLSKTYDNAPMPHSVFFKDGAAIHGSGSTAYLGRPASHGCVRLSPNAAKRFYALVGKHGFSRTRIIVSGKAPAVGFPNAGRTARYDRSASPAAPSRQRTRQSANWYYPSESSRFYYPGDTVQSRYQPYWSR